jgi:mono/diheme cytochrome c family protein
MSVPMLSRVLLMFVVFVLASCESPQASTDYEFVEPQTFQALPDGEGSYSNASIRQGKYLVELLSCGVCHSDGALIGKLNPNRLLAGSHIGIAYSNPMVQKNPGVIFPGNLTSDNETGLGSWQDEEIARVIRTGVNNHGKRNLSVMPWPGYAKMTDEDTIAIVAYLRSIPAVKHEVPKNIRPGKKARVPYVHFGVYRSKQAM